MPIASGMKIIVRQEENGFSLKDIEVNKKEIDKEKEYSIPVSYTHLDVYKRQLCVVVATSQIRVPIFHVL